MPLNTWLPSPNSQRIIVEDLIDGPFTGVIERVDGILSIWFVGVKKPYVPCLTMLRAISWAWGRPSVTWYGRAMTIFADMAVKGESGEAVGGVRISELSSLHGKENPFKVSVILMKGRRGNYAVRHMKMTAETAMIALRQVRCSATLKGMEHELAHLPEDDKVKLRVLYAEMGKYIEENGIDCSVSGGKVLKDACRSGCRDFGICDKVKMTTKPAKRDPQEEKQGENGGGDDGK